MISDLGMEKEKMLPLDEAARKYEMYGSSDMGTALMSHRVFRLYLRLMRWMSCILRSLGKLWVWSMLMLKL